LFISKQLFSLGGLGDKNKDHSKVIGQFIQDKLGIPMDRYDTKTLHMLIIDSHDQPYVWLLCK